MAAEGYFTDDSMLRQVVRERVMVLAGGRLAVVRWSSMSISVGCIYTSP